MNRKMKLIQETILQGVSDPLKMMSELDEIANEYIKEGWNVDRGIAGVIILSLPDGQVIITPDDGKIVQKVYEYEDDHF